MRRGSDPHARMEVGSRSKPELCCLDAAEWSKGPDGDASPCSIGALKDAIAAATDAAALDAIDINAGWPT